MSQRPSWQHQPRLTFHRFGQDITFLSNSREERFIFNEADAGKRYAPELLREIKEIRDPGGEGGARIAEDAPADTTFFSPDGVFPFR